MKLTVLLSSLFFVPLFAQDYTSYFTGNTADVVTNPKGGICMMGGATEHDEAMKWFLKQADGGDILVLRTSGSNGYNDYLFTDLGITINSVETIVCHNPNASQDSYIHQKIDQAEGIWFAGGDQWDYISYWRNTSVATLINSAIHQRKAVIGGTSAGMAIQGGFYFSAENGTVTSGAALANPYNSLVSVSNEAFIENHFLEDVITDTHYDNPDRKGRHVVFLSRILQDFQVKGKGIACDEYTAVCIDSSGLSHVYGDYPNYDEDVYFIQVNCELSNPAPEVCQANANLTWNHFGQSLKVYHCKGTMQGTQTFNLSDWQTGEGGVWENWSVNQGVLTQNEDDIPNCNLKIEEIKQLPFFLPNPVVSSELSIPSLDEYSVALSDLSGRVQKLKTDNKTLYFNNLPNGTYFLKLQNENQQLVFKLILSL